MAFEQLAPQTRPETSAQLHDHLIRLLDFAQLAPFSCNSAELTGS